MTEHKTDFVMPSQVDVSNIDGSEFIGLPVTESAASDMSVGRIESTSVDGDRMKATITVEDEEIQKKIESGLVAVGSIWDEDGPVGAYVTPSI